LSLCPYVLALFGVNPALNATPFPLFDPLLSNLTDLPDLPDLDDFYALGQNLGILGILGILADLGDLWSQGPGIWRDLVRLGRFADLGESVFGEFCEVADLGFPSLARLGDLQIWENLWLARSGSSRRVVFPSFAGLGICRYGRICKSAVLGVPEYLRFRVF